MNFHYSRRMNRKFRGKIFRLFLLFRTSRSLNVTTAGYWARQEHINILRIKRSKGTRKNWIGRKRYKNRNRGWKKSLYKPQMIYNWIFRFNKPNRSVRKWNKY